MKIKTLKQKLKQNNKIQKVVITDNNKTIQIVDVLFDKERKICYLITGN